METTYNNKTFKQFKNWVKDICKYSSDSYGAGCNYNTNHAIFSAYHIFRHHLKGQEITDFLDKDFNTSIKAFIRWGGSYIDTTLQTVSKQEGFDFQFDNPCSINQKCWLDNYYNEEDLKRSKQAWYDNVMSIYNFWHKKELKEIEIKRPSYYAFLKGQETSLGKKQLDNLNGIENMVWYCLKHDLSIEKAEEYIKSTLAKRSKINKLRYSFITAFNAYYLKDILNIDNSFFNVYEADQRVLKFKKIDEDGYCNYKHCDEDIFSHDVSYSMKSRKGYVFDDVCDTINEMTMKMYDYYKACPYYNDYSKLVISMYKQCNRTEHTWDIKEAIKFDDEYYISKKRPNVVNSEIEPITAHIRLSDYLPYIDLSTDITDEFARRREMYFNITMFVFMMYKCLDYLEETKNISYKEYCKPIYKNEVVEEKVEKTPLIKQFINKIIK